MRTSPPATGAESARAPGRSWPDGLRRLAIGRQRWAWAAAALAICLGGIATTVLVASEQSGRQEEIAQRAFAQTASNVASDLRVALRREDDLVVNAAGFVATNPAVSNAEFGQWSSAAQVLARHPEVQTLGTGPIVRQSELAAYLTNVAAKRGGGPAPTGVRPPGRRPFYCFGRAQITRAVVTAFPANFDFCADPTTRAALLRARDTGRSVYLPLREARSTLFSVITPVYRGGARPPSAAARRARFFAIVGVSIRPAALLERALPGRSGMALALRYHDAHLTAVFRAGKAPDRSLAATTNLGNGWSVRTVAAVPATGILSATEPRLVLIAGLLVSLLLGALVYLLGTGRARAMKLVEQKTGELHYQALHDSLTGLPNRALILDRTEQLLARNRRNLTSGAALYVDLDGFKNVNDSLGHKAGDTLLVAVAARLEAALRDADTIGRMGGDEFVVLLDGATLNVAPELVAERLLTVMRRPFELEGAHVPVLVSASIGIAVGDRAAAGDLLRDADLALYQAKAAGKNRFEVFFPEMQSKISHRIDLEFGLRTALENEEFRLVYQPIFNLDELTVVGVEALLRWNHPDGETVAPDEFIPILEQSGQIQEVGAWVLHEACRQMAAWHAQGAVLDLSVNVSARQLDDPGIVDGIRDALEESGLAPTSLIIEITETALMHNADAAAERLRRIKALGVRIAIDDFGTGYSSLAYLQRFPVDCLKIDRAFTGAIASSPESNALVGTLVQLGRDLGLTTLAEGLETSQQMAHLRDERVTEAQGFLLSKPLEPEQLEAQLLPSVLRQATTRPRGA